LALGLSEPTAFTEVVKFCQKKFYGEESGIVVCLADKKMKVTKRKSQAFKGGVELPQL
jgi:hypothetical protein